MSPEDLLRYAQQQSISSLALTDINNTSGIIDFVRLASKHGIKPVAGIEFRPLAPASTNQVLFIGLAKNNEGFRELNDFLSHHLHTDEPFPVCAPRFKNVAVIYPASNFQPVELAMLLSNPMLWRAYGGETAYIGITPHDLQRLRFSDLKNHLRKLVMLSPVTFRNKLDYNTHRLMRAIEHNTLLSKLDVHAVASTDEVMHHKYELIKMYGDFPQIIENTERLLDQCSINFEFGKNKNKKSFTGNFYEDKLLLSKLCNEGMKYRYPDANAEIMERYEKEISLISDMGFSSYFLMNHDIVNYAQHKNYFYVGRGSGANSMVAYLLRITDVDPIDLDLYFERFMNEFRINPPDFDLDFSWKDRDDVIEYIFNKHGKSHVAQLATYSTFQWNAVVRELGKVFGLPKAEIDKFLDRIDGPQERDQIGDLILKYGKRMIDFPNHLSIHAGGILISEQPIHCYTATSIPPKGFPITQFSMLEAEDIGLYKFDILSQRGLGHIKETVEIVKQNRGVEIDIHDIKKFKSDEKIKQHISNAECIGCFYVESPAMRGLLKKLRVDNYLALVAASSIIRPGVASSGMMREYIIRSRDPSKATYIHPIMQELMSETYGVMVYQEDVIRVAHHFAGLTLGEADMLRRGMSGKFRGRDEFMKIREKFFAGSNKNGHDPEISTEVWRQIESFAGYAFAKGHSASYAVESYQSLFLKAYYPKDFMVGVINNFGGFYRTEFYVHEARMCGANIHAPCINRSQHTTTISGDDIFLGFIHIGELEHKVSETILAERNRNGNFTSLQDFMNRISIAVEQLRILIRIGAFRFTGRTKKQLLWDIHTIIGAEKKTVAHKELFETERKNFVLPTLYHHNLDDVMDEIELLGFPLCSPFALIKKLPAATLLAKDLVQHIGKEVTMIGYLVTTKSTRTKQGEYMCFGTFIDSEGKFFDTTNFPKVAAQFPFRGRGCYFIKGRVDSDFDFCSIIVSYMERLEEFTRNDLGMESEKENVIAEVDVN